MKWGVAAPLTSHIEVAIQVFAKPAMNLEESRCPSSGERERRSWAPVIARFIKHIDATVKPAAQLIVHRTTETIGATLPRTRLF